ncbi:MAG: histidine phosphatase family protein [Hyphomicrobiaceae bacterium]|nr:MAG: histidine phosphatase family protein [Hyphomicrobiaceae bacterium]
MVIRSTTKSNPSMVITFVPRRNGGCNGCPLLLYDMYGQNPEECRADPKLMVARKGDDPREVPLARGGLCGQAFLMKIYLVRHGRSVGNDDKSVHLTLPDHAIGLSKPRGFLQATETGLWLRNELENLAEAPAPMPGWAQWAGCDAPQPFKARLWTSPYDRAAETAEAIRQACTFSRDIRIPDMSMSAGLWPVCKAGESLFLDVHEHILLAEQQFGLFDGIPDEDLPTRFPAEHAHYDKHAKHGGRFWARMPLGESRFDVAQRVRQFFGTLHRDKRKHKINTVVVVCHGVTMRAFVKEWFYKSVKWFEDCPNPVNGAVWLIDGAEDRGVVFEPQL